MRVGCVVPMGEIERGSVFVYERERESGDRVCLWCDKDCVCVLEADFWSGGDGDGKSRFNASVKDGETTNSSSFFVSNCAKREENRKKEKFSTFFS